MGIRSEQEETSASATKYIIDDNHGLNVGNTIRCLDNDNTIEVMMELQNHGIDTDFVYYDDGGVGLVVTKVNR